MAKERLDSKGKAGQQRKGWTAKERLDSKGKAGQQRKGRTAKERPDSKKRCSAIYFIPEQLLRPAVKKIVLAGDFITG